VIVPIMIMMNRKAWDPMSDADKAAFKAAFAAGAKVNDDLTRGDEARLVDFFKEKGMTIVNSDRPSFQKRMTAVYELGEKDFNWGKGTFEAMQALG
jgi:TRAP-type C4-dicarboxylate transport system substrate-binding protein